MKEENSTTPFLRETLKATAKLDVKERLKALKTAYLTHRQVGASEAVYKAISSMRLKDSNITCTFVASGFPENRSVKFTKIQEEVTEVENLDDEEGEAEGDGLCQVVRGSPGIQLPLDLTV